MQTQERFDNQWIDSAQRVLLVDDHSVFRQALATVIEQDAEFSVIGQAASLAEAMSKLDSYNLAIIDLSLPDGSGLSLIDPLRKINPEILVLVLTASVDRLDYAHAVESGAAGVLHKSTSIEELTQSLKRLLTDRWLVSQTEILELLRLARQRRSQARESETLVVQLTPREREVLGALADGLSSKDIAERLSMTVETERTHMVNILAKLGVHSRLQGLIVAVRHGLVTIQ